MVENVTQTKRGTTINVDVSGKIQENTIRVESILFGLLVHVVERLIYT